MDREKVLPSLWERLAASVWYTYAREPVMLTVFLVRVFWTNLWDYTGRTNVKDRKDSLLICVPPLCPSHRISGLESFVTHKNH